MSGEGCPKCGMSKRSFKPTFSSEMFIEKARKVSQYFCKKYFLLTFVVRQDRNDEAFEHISDFIPFRIMCRKGCEVISPGGGRGIPS